MKISALVLILVAACAARPQTAAQPAIAAPLHPNERTQMIQELDQRIATDRQALGLPPQPSSDAADHMTGLEPVSPPQAASTGACKQVCDLADDICHNQDNICRLADELTGDDWAKGRCDAAKASCKEAKDRCEKCPSMSSSL